MNADRLRSRTAGWPPTSKASNLERNRTSGSRSGPTVGLTRSSVSRRQSVPTVRRSSTPRRRSVASASVESARRTSQRFNHALRERGCSPSTRAKHLRVLGACLQAAVFYRYAESNPVRELPPSQRPRPDRKEAAYFENDELPRLFATSRTSPTGRCASLRSRRACGKGSCFALRWCDVDLEEAVVRVRRSYTGGTIGTPKNRERRDVDLISDVVELLTRLAARSGQRKHRDGLVFPGDNGTRIPDPFGCSFDATSTRRWQRASIPRVGPTQEKRTFHSFRHTFAKRALESGAQITWLSRHLGHSIAQGDDRHLRALGACRAKAPSGQDGGRLPGLTESRTPPVLHRRPNA